MVLQCVLCIILFTAINIFFWPLQTADLNVSWLDGGLPVLFGGVVVVRVWSQLEIALYSWP